MNKANKVDAIGTVVGAAIGATTVTSFVESTVGVSAGAKTGFSALVTASMFGLSIAT
jgi:AGZA family xanthine/uracil permease-like MFS transporter